MDNAITIECPHCGHSRQYLEGNAQRTGLTSTNWQVSCLRCTEPIRCDHPSMWSKKDPVSKELVEVKQVSGDVLAELVGKDDFTGRSYKLKGTGDYDGRCIRFDDGTGSGVATTTYSYAMDMREKCVMARRITAALNATKHLTIEEIEGLAELGDKQRAKLANKI